MNKGYKITIGVLILIIIVQGFIIFFRRPVEKKPISKPKAPIKFRIEKGKAPSHKIIPLAKGEKIAIILDDWGYNLNNLPILEQIKYPLTLSILPNLPYSKTLAQKSQEYGFEAILHLPGEPFENLPLEENTILTSMDSQAIKNIIEMDLSDLIYIKGVSNHMGSKLTQDMRTMNIVLEDLKKRKLYFVDSYVTSNSVVSEIAKKLQVPTAKRDVFLDNKLEYEYIRQQLNKLKMKAKINGYAIGVGHDRKVTLEVLKDYMPVLEKEGFKFVFASELVK